MEKEKSEMKEDEIPLTESILIEDDQELIRKIYRVLCYCVTLFVLIGMPLLWWYSTVMATTDFSVGRIYETSQPPLNKESLGLPLSLDYEILVTIVNQDPENLRLYLHVEDIKAGLDPFLKKLTPVANFDLKFQWLYSMELGAKLHKNENGFILYEKYVPHVILPIEEKLQSYPTAKPRINLILYFPKCDVTPLYIANAFDQLIEDNSYLTPKWGGGIYFVNQYSPTCVQKYFKPDMASIIKTFTSQIKRLIHLRSDNETDLFEFKLERATDFVKMARCNLKSISQIFAQVGNIVMTDRIGRQIPYAMENCDVTETLLKAANVDVEEALKVAKVAFNASRNALNDVSLLSLLYSPKN